MGPRLRDLVGKQGIAKFTADDFKLVTNRVATDPGRLILVGGQAIEVWAVLFDVPSPLGKGIALTEDTDWLGGKRDAQWLCSLLEGSAKVDLQFSTDFESPVSSAIAFIQRDDRILLMDFLRAIVGPSIEEVKRLAVQVDLDGGAIKVPHPLLCLHSRLANIREIAAKRNENGLAQARWMIDIFRAYLLKMIGTLDSIQLAKNCREVAKLAEFQPGRFCYEHFQIDPLLAIDNAVVEHVGGKFLELEWPNLTRRIRDKQAGWLEFKKRTQVHIPGS